MNWNQKSINGLENVFCFFKEKLSVGIEIVRHTQTRDQSICFNRNFENQN
jgi:hypothetical protein